MKLQKMGLLFVGMGLYGSSPKENKKLAKIFYDTPTFITLSARDIENSTTREDKIKQILTNQVENAEYVNVAREALAREKATTILLRSFIETTARSHRMLKLQNERLEQENNLLKTHKPVVKKHDHQH
jgi:hypothetical protein